MHYHRGPVFDKWRRAMVACVGGVLIEDAVNALGGQDGADGG